MTPYAWQIRFRLETDRPLAASTGDRRRVACTILRAGRAFKLLAARWLDTHGHALLVGTRSEAGELARRAEIGLQHALRPGVPFQPAHFTPIRDVWHLANTFAYVLRQGAHHGVHNDRHHDASTLVDLLGLRTTGLFTVAHVREHLPRTQSEDLLALLGVPDLDGEPDFEELLEAARAACGLPSLDHSHDAVRARIAAIHLAQGELSARELAERLEIAPRTVRKLRTRTPDPDVTRAIRRQLVFRATLSRESAPLPFAWDPRRAELR